MDGSLNPLNADQHLEALPVLWAEYQYRHDLIWRVMFQLTAAIVILAVLPYVKTEVVEVLGRGILAVPFLSIALILFGGGLIKNELKLFDKIKKAYRQRQSRLFPDICHRCGKSNFRGLVTFYFLSIFVLSLFNLVVLWWVWIPHVTSGSGVLP